MFYFKIEIVVSSFKVQSIEFRAGYFCTSCKERLGFRKRRKKGQRERKEKSGNGESQMFVSGEIKKNSCWRPSEVKALETFLLSLPQVSAPG